MEHLAGQFDDRKVTEAALRARADDVLDRIRDAVAPVTAKHADALWSCLNAIEKRDTEQAALMISPDIDWGTALDTGSYGLFVTAAAVAAMVRECPDLLLDGEVFRRSWKTGRARTSRREQR